MCFNADSMTESIELTKTCPGCGQACVVHAGEVWSDWRRELAWFRSFACERCGGRSEEDGDGFPEPELRDALLREHGRWAIEVIGPSPVVVAKALRKVLGLSLCPRRRHT